MYAELLDLLRQDEEDMKIRYTELYRILCMVLEQATAQSRMDFSGPFARLTYLASALRMEPSLRLRLNSLRSRCRQLEAQGDEDLRALLPFDVRAVAELISLATRQAVPVELRSLLPVGPMPATIAVQENQDCLRICVKSWDEDCIRAVSDDVQGGADILVCYADPENRMGDWTYLRGLLWEGCQLNLVRYHVRDGVYYAELVILEPDFLVDISRLSQCFGEAGATSYHYLLSLIQPQAHSAAILMGNMAGLILDRESACPAGESADYAECAKLFMQQNALDIITCPDSLADFHAEARRQQQNIHHVLDVLQQEDAWFHRDRILLEPSFFCEMLGVQGRMDLLQDDFRVLLEQKAGKRAFQTEAHREPHYVQMLLYQAVLHYAFHLRNDQISSYLLYSRFPDGLIKEGPAPHLLFQALQIRNQIVWLQFQLAKGSGRLMDALTPERFNPLQRKDRLWVAFQRPKIAALLDAMHGADALTRAYFYRMVTFVAREHLLSKIGTPGREASGLSSLWNSSLQEKLVAGNIVHNLLVREMRGDNGSVEEIVLEREGGEEAFLPNFRIGDIVILYSYPRNSEPDVRRAVVFRATLIGLASGQFTFHLRNPQHNPHLFPGGDSSLWAVEKDSTESSFTALYRSLYSLFKATPRRRALLLGQRAPQIDEAVALQGDYSQGGRFPHFNQLVLQARQARDYFLLVGPPGTGKTSFGLMNILVEELKTSQDGVLLLSYTNRAVDEICSKLVAQGLDFVRISSADSCAPEYKPFLFSRKARQNLSAGGLRKLLLQTPIVVGTTTSITSAQSLFSLRRFGLAIIDEASQILEPHLIGILCARSGEADAVQRFVLIGDHRQLPAVVQQEPAESAVTDPQLQAIGLTDCRNSLFQRLIALSADKRVLFSFTYQGRMHPQVAEFANRHFYGGLLEPVPLAHQLEPLYFSNVDKSDEFQTLLSSRRVIFQSCERPAHSPLPKVNQAEARLIARFARAVYQLYVQNGRPFLPEESVGVIVPYRHQIALIYNLLAESGVEALQHITVDTVERYQGSQRDVIIYGFTVQKPYQLDFLCSQTFQEGDVLIDRKLNVALTRAREQIVLIGNPQLLALNPVLGELCAEYLVD
ncbi:MAG: AAA family ATPase [Bacteroidaceae bacterium]|nr:AAA family ATPase [Bacteroidaceae bacterium]